MFPFIEIFGLQIPMYGICMTCGLLISTFVAMKRVQKTGRDSNDVIVVAACAVAGGLVGAKFLYIIVSYGLDQAITDMLNGDFTSLSAGGLVYYGGLIGGIIGAFAGAKIVKVKLKDYCDSIVPCIPLGHAFGRMGCFFAGCCHGRACDGAFCISFPAAGINYSVFPVQLVEVVLNVLLFFLLIWLTGKKHYGLSVLYIYLLIYSTSRFLLEFLRGDSIRGVLGIFSTSQWISLVLLAASAVLLLVNTRQKRAGGAN